MIAYKPVLACKKNLVQKCVATYFRLILAFMRIDPTKLFTIKLAKMKKTKMSLANIQGKLTKAEMKKIMAGSGQGDCARICFTAGDCSFWTSCTRCSNNYCYK
jgi:hypothetical protein